ncbi:CHASE2 domain-containing protein [Leadbettera azotonutricia]|uniref:Adenylate/guanylate cyclase catalytic domain protein n=1 Tax=Leadbettera azotonutricia (strain ATCC BAA-888 / DSM 13862 / ZAS-9) TaxID=545695 RepID=F5Y8K2_LEAAZ|nr:CHASE2 domain-containing protein [Leadbettera azotonutricia]AEF81564.1 adenylate/guanylate cyclase catalytic domain protein [Leadbettera azotonutricia ZAS-9]
MTIRKLSILTAFGAAALFSLLYLAPFFAAAESKIYDVYLGFRPPRQRIQNVAFLDIDDQAIAQVGVFPWPRSVIADGLVRLKEYGIQAAIFDIEFIDKSPTQVDELYLQQGLAADYDRRFSEVGSGMAEILEAISAGQIGAAEASRYIDDVTLMVQEGRDTLYRETMQITRDNDLHLAEASALLGKVWGTLNLQEQFALEGEQAQRLALAEERFSYPIADPAGVGGGSAVDILPALPLFMEAVKGAGFTNVAIDSDGIRRRLYLARKVKGRWYLQLAFAPLVDMLGRPDIEVGKGRLVIKGSGGDTVIPLDKNGAMLLDWPRETYAKSYEHVSFVRLTILEEYQRHIEQYLGALAFIDKGAFPFIAEGAVSLRALFEEAELAKDAALAETSDAEFGRYIALRNQGFEALGVFTTRAFAYLEETVNSAADLEAIMGEAEYCNTLLEYLDTELHSTREQQAYLEGALDGKMCIIGRVDTGTTDIGVNPFHGEYVNVGTHGVLLDTILSGSFMQILPPWWSVILAFLLVPLVIVGISGRKPLLRILLGISSIALTLLITFALFYAKGLFLGPLGPALAMAAALIVRETIAFAGTEKEKVFIRSAFSRYLAPAVIDQIVADPSRLQLGGQRLEMTAIFTDVRSFSTISEALKDETGEPDPHKLVELLNFYLTRMSDIVLANQGTIDKYEGDAIIAFFGAPLHMENHASLAVRSALEMKKAEVLINKEAMEKGLLNADVAQALLAKKIINSVDEPLIFTRLGINTGMIVVGNMGTPNKMDYTIMGNSVNLAARLEGVNKQYNTGGILISGYTRKHLGDEFVLRRLDRVRVVGITTWVRLYEVMELTSEAGTDLLERIKLFDEGVDIFEKEKDWAKAAKLFKQYLALAPSDGPAKLYLARCQKFQKTPPDPKWEGVFNLDQK